MKKRKEYFDGYLTVEASILVPITFVILMLLIYWGFYCYDKSVSVQCSYLAALRGASQWESSDEKRKEYAQEQLEDLADKTFLFIRTKDLYAKKGIGEITTGVRGGMDILVGMDKIRSNDNWMLKSEKRASTLKPTYYIRIFRAFGTK